jgi:hypothetical protein
MRKKGNLTQLSSNPATTADVRLKKLRIFWRNKASGFWWTIVDIKIVQIDTTNFGVLDTALFELHLGSGEELLDNVLVAVGNCGVAGAAAARDGIVRDGVVRDGIASGDAASDGAARKLLTTALTLGT